MTNEELLEKIGEFMQPLVNGIAHLKTEVSHLKTAVDALKAGQDDLRAEMATKADKEDIKRLEQKIDQTTKDHEERLEHLELAHHKN
jgi:peptidoglycan hydrolase CwlO-like protein